MKNTFLFAIWGCYFNLPFYDKETESQRSTSVKTTVFLGCISFFLSQYILQHFHTHFTKMLQTSTSNFKRNCRDKQATEMCANKELSKKGHATCIWKPKISSLKKSQKNSTQTHLAQVRTRVTSSTTRSTSSQISLSHPQSDTAELGCNSTSISYSAVQSRSTEGEERNEVFMRCEHAQKEHQNQEIIWCRVAREETEVGTVDVLKR